MKTKHNSPFCKNLLSFNSAMILIIGLSLTSCAPVLYSTVGTNAPLLKEKGEVALSGGYAQVDSENNGYLGYYSGAGGINLQFAAAVDSNLAVISSFYTLGSKDDEFDWTGNGTYFELGIGKFASGKKSKNLIGEVFIGTGFGSIRNSSGYAEIRTSYIKPFLQPSGGVRTKYFDFALTPRFGMVCYTGHQMKGLESDASQIISDYFSNKKATFVFEPGFTIRGGVENIKIQYQVNFTTFRYSETIDDEEFNPVNRLYSSLGIYLLFSNHKSKKK